MSPAELGPGGIPIPDADHTYLVTAQGFPITDRGAQPGDKYAWPSLPYHYKGYTHPKGVDPESAAAKAQEKSDRATLDMTILDLSQTPSGRKFLTAVFEAGYAFQHRPDDVSEAKASAINDRPSKSLWLGQNGYVPAQQLTGMHEMGHFLRNIGLADDAGLIGSEPLLYFSDDGLERSVEIARLQEGSSEADAARHAVETTLINNPNHYRPPGVFEELARDDFRKEKAEVALASVDLLRTGQEAEFHRRVHQAFYKPENLAYYDEQVLMNFNCWRPRDGGGDNYKKTYMSTPPLTQSELAKMLPYMAGSAFVEQPLNRALTDAQATKEQYAILKGIIEPQYVGTSFKPLYQVPFMSEVQATASTSAASRMLTRLEMDILGSSGVHVPPQATQASGAPNLAIMQLQAENASVTRHELDLRQRA